MKRFVYLLGCTSVFLTIFFYVSFFLNLRSTLSDWSGFGVVWPIQLLYNFTHGRPFQSSLFATLAGGAPIGLIYNPYAYIHAFVIHVNFIPYLFAYLWNLHASVGGLYAIIIGWNLIGGLGFGWLILRRLSPEDLGHKFILASSIFLASAQLSIYNQMAQFLMFAGPLYLAAYYCFLERKKLWFVIAIAAICFTSEDAAMNAVFLAGYLHFFEGEEGIPYAHLCGAVAIPYVLFVILAVQPAARAQLTMAGSSTVTVIIKEALHLKFGLLLGNLKSMLPVIAFLPSFAMVGNLFGWSSLGAPSGRKQGEVYWIKIAALAVFPALPHWAECVMLGGGHHLLPPFIFCYLALLVMLGEMRIEEKTWSLHKVNGSAWAATALFLLLSVRAVAGNLPNAMRPSLYRLAGKRDKAEALERSLTVEKESNFAVIAAAQALPAEKSLVYWANNRVAGYIAARSDIWEFPDFFDKADYLLIQKDAIDLNYYFNPSASSGKNASGLDLSRILKATSKGNERNVPMRPEMMRPVVEWLTRKEGGYRIMTDCAHFILLERLTHSAFENPSSTMSLGWTRRLFAAH